ncbi:MAG: SpoIIE family protein phosphatase [Bacteroidales bacterium]|nr:SpoIIE family protein phosphatase [Bacteroidales bacterium]
MSEQYYIEVGVNQRNHDKERICGDMFLSEKLKGEQRVISVLTDGMGHGVKANVLATLTAKMAMNFTKDKKEFNRIAEVILCTLPVCSERKMSYATFSIVDIQIGGNTRILEYGNPQTIVVRDGKILDLNWKNVVTNGQNIRRDELAMCEFTQQKDDRILMFSDGVTQSGLGTPKYPTGFGHENLNKFILDLLHNDSKISAQNLAKKIVNFSHLNDNYKAGDDISCACIYLRTPRKIMLFTGPPIERKQDSHVAELVKKFDGKKIVSGATTADLLSREWLEPVIDEPTHFPGFPPTSRMDGVDLVTEGVITLNAVAEILDRYKPTYVMTQTPPDRIIKMLLESDEITILVGTRLNRSHLDPTLPTQFELRRTVVKRLIGLLETKFLKDVKVIYI